MNRVLWCISVFFIGSLLFAAPINEITPDPIFKNDSISAYGYRKAYILPELNSRILKTSKEVSEMLLNNPGGVSSGLKLWLKADAGLDSYSRTAGAKWEDQSGQNNDAENATENSSSQVSASSISHPKLNNGTTDLFNYNPTMSFDKSQMEVGLPITPATIGSMETFVVVKGLNAVFGNGNTNEVERHMATHRFKSGNGSDNYTDFPGGLANLNVLSVLHLNHNGTSNALATGYMSVNGGSLGSFSERNLDGGFTNKFILGHAGAYGNFQGELAEFIIYDSAQSTLNRDKIFSYLSIKYGIPAERSGFDYLSGGGATIFDASEQGDYVNNVFGLGKDTNTSLDQQISESNGSQLIVSLQNDFSSANTASVRNSNWESRSVSYLIISSNTGSNELTNTNVDGSTFVKRFNRVWKVNTTNFTQNVALKFASSSFSSSEAAVSYLITDADGDFSSGAVNEGIIGSDKVITGVSFNSARPYFTVARMGILPGLSNFEDTDKIYTDSDFTYDVPSSNSSGALTYSSSNTTVATIDENTRLVQIKGVGTTIITATQQSNGNYYSGTITATLTVSRAPLTVSANNKSKVFDRNIYSDGYTVSVSGFRSGENVTNLSGSPAFSGTAIAATNPGDYIITPSGYSSDNYTFSYVNGTLSINKVNLTISGITGNSKEYDGNTSASLNSSSPIFTGLLSGDDIGYAVTGAFINKK